MVVSSIIWRLRQRQGRGEGGTGSWRIMSYFADCETGRKVRGGTIQVVARSVHEVWECDCDCDGVDAVWCWGERMEE